MGMSHFGRGAQSNHSILSRGFGQKPLLSWDPRIDISRAIILGFGGILSDTANPLLSEAL